MAEQIELMMRQVKLGGMAKLALGTVREHRAVRDRASKAGVTGARGQSH